MKFNVSERVCWKAGEEESLSPRALCPFSTRARFSQWQSTGSLLGFVPASRDPPNADWGLVAGVLKGGNPGQCVLQRTYLFAAAFVRTAACFSLH